MGSQAEAHHLPSGEVISMLDNPEPYWSGLFRGAATLNGSGWDFLPLGLDFIPDPDQGHPNYLLIPSRFTAANSVKKSLDEWL